MVLSIVLGPGFLLLSLAALVLSVWALIDAATRPTWAWEASGQNKTLWIVLNVVGLFVCGLVIGLIYLLAIRPKVAAAQQGGAGGAGGYGGSTAAWGPPPGAPGDWNPGGSPPGGPNGWDRPPPTAPPPPPAGGIPAGWYPDPAGTGQLRYWNGDAWTEQSPPA